MKHLPPDRKVTHWSLKMSNFTTTVTEFLLMGFSDTCELQILYSLLFFLTYSAGLMGNVLIVIVTTFDRRLHTPMYFFLRNLSIVDACFISITVPQASINSLVNNRVISVPGCAAQIFLVTFIGYVEFTLLTVMAHDRYVAICQPLLYPVIMSPRVCMQMTLTCLFAGLLYASFHTGYTFRLSFCRSNVINQFFCDIPSLLKISCSETFSNMLYLLVSSLVTGVGCFIFITASYISIFSTVLKFPVKEDQKKAFSTCVPHIIVVSLFVISVYYVYLKPPSDSGSLKDIILSIFYCVVPPFMNPIIYSLRNKQIKEAARIVMKGKFLLRNKI
ncbi:olfactory receptor 14C36-like [Trichosurus vulpecula]|uniref:olfactory receptor 14C36-like n=1 Tax=Trichosurus vulpecula TaxID=9337 RepID=UPI00186B0763|nr:olfactory receptor 14C36-like [Trichosurus vulpecula]